VELLLVVFYGGDIGKGPIGDDTQADRDDFLDNCKVLAMGKKYLVDSTIKLVWSNFRDFFGQLSTRDKATTLLKSEEGSQGLSLALGSGKSKVRDLLLLNLEDYDTTSGENKVADVLINNPEAVVELVQLCKPFSRDWICCTNCGVFWPKTKPSGSNLRSTCVKCLNSNHTIWVTRFRRLDRF
jgi:hypothetical protein